MVFNGGYSIKENIFFMFSGMDTPQFSSIHEWRLIMVGDIIFQGKALLTHLKNLLSRLTESQYLSFLNRRP